LVSLLRAAAECDEAPRFTFVNDGPIPDVRLEVMRAAGDVVALGGLGNSRAYRRALAETCARSTTADLAYLVEDDYLHLPDSLAALTQAAAGVPEASYFTLYDHPDHAIERAALTAADPGVFVVGDRVWRVVPSTTMTFAARPGALRADRWVHWLGTVPHTPRDHQIWLTAQRAGWRRIVPSRGRRGLVATTPALATHLEDGMLAPGVDWDAAAEETRAWAAARGLPVSDESGSTAAG
jgi:hypothetical protein